MRILSRFPGSARPIRWSIARSTRGVAALEFAMMAPVLVAMLLGVYDLSRGWMASRQLTTSAFSIGQIATILAVQPDSTSKLTAADAWRAATAMNGAMPQTLTSGSSYSVSFAEVTFSTDSSCQTPVYCIANVAWTALIIPNQTLPTSQQSTLQRSCGRLIPTDDTNPPDLTMLPKDVFTASPVLVVDVYYTYTPLFLSGVVKQFTMHWMATYGARSGNLQNRSDQIISFDNSVAAPGSSIYYKNCQQSSS